MTMDLARAQADMRFAYYGGAAGMFASAAAWAGAAVAAWQATPRHAVWLLLIAGMAIHPAAVLISKALGRPGAHSKGNPLAPLAAASTFWLVFCLPLAYSASLLDVAWFFPAMLLVIGGRYLVFGTLYGLRLYWACGLGLAAAAWLLVQAKAGPTLGAVAGAAIEAGFACAIVRMQRRDAMSGDAELHGR